LLFLMADSYRKSAGLLDAKLGTGKLSAATQPAVDLAAMARASFPTPSKTIVGR
jgi:hypothetical protein